MGRIAAQLGVGKKTGREFLQRGAIPVERIRDVRAVRTKHITDYRHDRQAIPVWENEGGACRPERIEDRHDNAR